MDSFVAIGAPQYGSPGGCVQGPADGYDTCMFSEVLTKLNAGEDTPGSAYYSVVQSSGEWADGRLDGGQCRVYVDGVPGAGTGGDHLTELEHPEVISGAISALERDCVGTFVDENDGDITWPDTAVSVISVKLQVRVVRTSSPATCALAAVLAPPRRHPDSMAATIRACSVTAIRRLSSRLHMSER